MATSLVLKIATRTINAPAAVNPLVIGLAVLMIVMLATGYPRRRMEERRPAES